MDLLQKVFQSSLRTKPIGDFKVGDTVNVHTKIKEGDKERIQIFNGTVISRTVAMVKSTTHSRFAASLLAKVLSACSQFTAHELIKSK